MASDYDRLFGLPSLNGRVEAFGSDVNRPTVFAEKFALHGRDILSEDGTVQWDEITFSQGMAPVAGRKGRHKRKNPLAKVVRRSACMHIKRSVVLDPDRLFFEREPGQLRPNAEAYVEAEMRDLMGEIETTKAYACAESLRGTLTVNSTNVPGSEQAFAIAYSPNIYTKSAGWATVSTGITSSEIPLLKIDHRRSSGFEAAQAICGSTVEGYIGANTEVTTLARNMLGDRFVTQSGQMEGPMFGGLEIGGLKWHVTEGGYIPAGGSFTRYLPTVDEAIVLPADADLRDVLGMATGFGLVPVQNLGPASAAAGLIRPAPQRGWYSYASLVPGTPAVEVFVGWVGLPVVLRPAAVTVADLD